MVRRKQLFIDIHEKVKLAKNWRTILPLVFRLFARFDVLWALLSHTRWKTPKLLVNGNRQDLIDISIPKNFYKDSAADLYNLTITKKVLLLLVYPTTSSWISYCPTWCRNFVTTSMKKFLKYLIFVYIYIYFKAT